MMNGITKMCNMTFQDMLIPFTVMCVVIFVSVITITCLVCAIITRHNSIRNKAKEYELLQREQSINNMYEHVNNMFEIVQNTEH